MKLQKIVSRLQELHPKEIDLSLDRIQNLCQRLGNPQDKLKAISIVGTNGKYSTIQAMFAILKEANIKCNIYTSPHIKSINERFVFNNQEVYNRQNDSERRTLEDIIWSRQFGSYIIKESNVYDRFINEYKAGLNALLEAERIKEMLFLQEHDVWHF